MAFSTRTLTTEDFGEAAVAAVFADVFGLARHHRGVGVHGWWQCPEGGAKPGPDDGSQVAAHAPTRREVKTLALCKIFDDAAEQGPREFQACMMRFGEPALLEGERVHWDDSSSDDEDGEADLSFQQVSHLPAAPQTSSDMPQGRAGGNISVMHAQLEQPERPQQVVQPTGGAPVRWRDRQAVGPLYAGGDGLHYPARLGGSAAVGAPVGANALALSGGAEEDSDDGGAGDEFE
eukprot:gene24439-29714_t